MCAVALAPREYFAAKAARALKRPQELQGKSANLFGEESGCDGLAISICRRSI